MKIFVFLLLIVNISALPSDIVFKDSGEQNSKCQVITEDGQCLGDELDVAEIEDPSNSTLSSRSRIGGCPVGFYRGKNGRCRFVLLDIFG